jgi:hypothetical protein
MKIQSRIYGAFTGWHGDALFKLVNGQYWLQAECKYSYRYLYRPAVVIIQSGSDCHLEVEGMDGSVRVRMANAIESRIGGEFNGWSGDTVFELQNGQIWKQARYAYWYHYAYHPEVVIYESNGGYVLCLADDFANSIAVQKVR